MRLVALLLATTAVLFAFDPVLISFDSADVRISVRALEPDCWPSSARSPRHPECLPVHQALLIAIKPRTAATLFLVEGERVMDDGSAVPFRVFILRDPDSDWTVRPILTPDVRRVLCISRIRVSTFTLESRNEAWLR